MSSLLPIDAALARVDAACRALPEERVALSAALGRVLAAPALSRCALPPFAQSAMDGYALRCADVATLPAVLPLGEVVAAGPQPDRVTLPPGHAMRIFTGGRIPDGADTVVQQEWTQPRGAAVEIQRAPTVGMNVRPRAEEIDVGRCIAPAGHRLTPGLLASLSAAGVVDVAVHRSPRVRVLVTGDEIVAPGRSLRPGEVYDANGPLLRAWFVAQGWPIPDVRYVPDDDAAVAEALASGFGETDVLLTTGGVSVGDRDFVAPVAERLGAERLLWKVAQKPGKPLYVARHGGCLLLGLPGNPASVLVNLCVYVRRVLEQLQGRAPRPWSTGLLGAELRPDAQRDGWLRMRHTIDDAACVRLQPLPRQASHMLTNLADADVLVRVPASARPYPAGTPLCWQSLFVPD